MWKDIVCMMCSAYMTIRRNGKRRNWKRRNGETVKMAKRGPPSVRPSVRPSQPRLDLQGGGAVAWSDRWEVSKRSGRGDSSLGARGHGHRAERPPGAGPAYRAPCPAFLGKGSLLTRQSAWIIANDLQARV